MEISITFTVTNEYVWSGDLSDLPARIRKGGKLTRREDGETVLDEDALSDRLDDGALSELVKYSEVESEEFELEDVTEV